MIPWRAQMPSSICLVTRVKFMRERSRQSVSRKPFPSFNSSVKSQT